MNRKKFLLPINHINLEKILSFCVNDKLKNCEKSNDGTLAFIKLREGYEVPTYFKGLEEVTGIDLFTDERFKKIEENELS